MKNPLSKIEIKKSAGAGTTAVFLTLSLLCGTPSIAETIPVDMTRPEQTVAYQAQQAIKKKDYAVAQNILKTYIDKHPQGVHYRLTFALGNALLMAGELEEALGHYRTAAAVYPEDAAVWQNMGKVFYDLKMYSDAGDSLVRAAALIAPSSARISYQAAVAYILAENPKAACSLLDRIVSQAGGTPEPVWLEALLKVRLDLGQQEKAFKLVCRLLRDKGDNPQMWQILARLYVDRGEYQNAAAALEVYSSLTPASEKEKRLLGDIYRMANVPLKAARQYEKIITIDNDDDVKPADCEKAASAYLAAHRPNKAIDVLQRGLESHPTSRMWWMLASTFYAKEDFEEAHHAFEKSTQSDPKNAGAHLMIGYCAIQLDHMQAAKKAFAQAARFPQQHAEAEKMLNEIDQITIVSSKEVVRRQLP